MREIRLEEIDSTNNYAKLNLDNFADRTVVHAHHQTSGRGRLNRSWVDLGENNLFMTIVLKPSKSYSDMFSNITQYLSVCLCHVLESYGVKAEIKWPNDVLICGKKIAGILSEAVVQSNGTLKGIVLGIGVNLNADIETVKAIPDKIATALNIETGKCIDVDVFREELLKEFFANYDMFLDKGFELIKQEYISKNCFLGKELNIQIFDKVENGLAKAVTDKGELVLLKDNNELVLTIGDIL